MDKDLLKQMSEETFFDNDTGGITAQSHRDFNEALIDAIPDSIPIINVTNFDTFNPKAYDELADIPLGGFALITSTGAVGRPLPTQTSSPFNKWNGRITRIDNNYYVIEVICPMSTALNNQYPAHAIRNYTSSNGTGAAAASLWRYSGANTSGSQTGYVKFLSNTMIQWGYASGGSTVVFPTAFVSTPCLILSADSAATTSAIVHNSTGLSNTGFSLVSKSLNATQMQATTAMCRWIAIGTGN